MTDALNAAIATLQQMGIPVMREDFPPAPLPGSYTVGNVRMLTEGQVIDYAARMHTNPPLAIPVGTSGGDVVWVKL